MIIEVKIPSPGESIKQVQLANWLVKEGDYVEKDQELAEIDTDKATLSISSPEDGVIKILIPVGETIEVGVVVCTIDTGAKKEVKEVAPENIKKVAAPVQEAKKEIITPIATSMVEKDHQKKEMHITPLARKLMEEKSLTENELTEMLKRTRISRNDVKEIISLNSGGRKPENAAGYAASRDIDKKKMTTLRLKLSERLVAVKNQTAMLTTFNEVNMSAIMAIRSKYNEKFKEKNGISVGFMSFFSRAVVIALQEFSMVNSQIDGEDLVVPHYVDLGIAVSSQKGLVVPVIRNAEGLGLAELEGAIKDLANKARSNKLTIDEMTGGTFTITNGGVFGSMMSTPILNPPQSAILGMHNIIDRPVALNGKVEIQPMMYVALSYDHRIIDGKESVSFLVKVKEMLENPVRMLFSGADPNIVLLDL